MITDRLAQRIASSWHGGGGSPLYQFASTGAIVAGILPELDTCTQAAQYEGISTDDVDALRSYVVTVGERGPIADWYARVICD